MADVSQLSRLMKKADAVSHSAAWLVARAIRDVRGEIANLSGEWNLAGNADDRERAYSMVRRRMDGLSRRLDRLLEAQQQLTAKGAAKSAATLTGLEVKYSPSRAKAICELVTPAQGENLAAVFTDRMGAKLIGTLREATVATLREQAVSGGTMKETARRMAESWQAALKDERPVFVDSGGNTWNTETYFQMNVRTNTMRVYNDCLADNVARATGSDLMRISTGGSDPNCECAAWEGCIVSLTGKTPGFPTYEDARKGGCFHPNCVHTLEPVDETADADEIKLQKAVPASGETASDWEAQDERKYEIDQARKMRDEGLTREQARVAVDRDNLAASIRAGLVRGDAEAVVRKMTDAQVTALCPNGNPPEFLPTKRIPGGTRANPKYEPEKWNHGKWGGVVHIGRDATAEQILKVCKVEDAKAPEPPATPPKPVEKPKPEPKKEDKEVVEAREKLRGCFDTSTPNAFSEEDKAMFDGIPPEMAKAYAGAITKIVRTTGTSCCNGSLIRINKRAWSNCKHTYCHEAGHAVLEKANGGANYFFGSKLQPKGDAMLATIKKDAEALFDRLCGKMLTKLVLNKKTGVWEEKQTKSRAWHLLSDSALVKDILKSDTDYYHLSLDDKHVVGAVMDTIQAATKSKYTGPCGHNLSYYSTASMRIHEPFANISELMATGNGDLAKRLFPESTRMIAKDFYGITLDTPKQETLK